MKITRCLALAAVAAGLLLALRGGSSVTRSTEVVAGAPPRGLANGAPSLDVLVNRFLVALSSGDHDALDEMRVSEAEYRGLIVPGSVAPGEPPQVLSKEASLYFWQDLNARSTYTRNELLRRFGGKSLALVDFHFDKGTRRFANHVAHRRLVVTARDEHGEDVEIRTGSIVDVDGGFKFVSFVRG